MKVEIKKPLYETKEGVVVGIYSRKIDDAIRRREFITIKCGEYSETYMPKWIRANCKVIEKVFLRPDEPMRLYEVFISSPSHREQREKNKIKALAKMGVFG